MNSSRRGGNKNAGNIAVLRSPVHRGLDWYIIHPLLPRGKYVLVFIERNLTAKRHHLERQKRRNECRLARSVPGRGLRISPTAQTSPANGTWLPAPDPAQHVILDARVTQTRPNSSCRKNASSQMSACAIPQLVLWCRRSSESRGMSQVRRGRASQ